MILATADAPCVQSPALTIAPVTTAPSICDAQQTTLQSDSPAPIETTAFARRNGETQVPANGSLPIAKEIVEPIEQQLQPIKTIDNNDKCCRACQTAGWLNGNTGKPSVRKLIRKSRSRKHKAQIEACHARVRSLSVGNETCFRNGNRRTGRSVAVDGISGDASSGASGKERNTESLLRRNDLIDIIRESMEKNRLCFQSNG